MRKVLWALAAALVCSGAAALAATTASAHSRPIRFDPAPGAVLQSAPAQVQGWFTADIRRDPNWSFIRVADAQGNRVDTGEVQLSSDRRQMSVALKSGLAPGRYIVTWRTYDDGDGAIFGDCYAFFVGQAAADAAVTSNSRLDGGGSCARIEVSAKNGTPVPGLTVTAVPAAAADVHDDDHSDTAAGSDGGSDVPWWALIAGIGGGLAVGMVGGSLVSRRRA
jgi:methionine-rich copper-binding protein CopC